MKDNKLEQLKTEYMNIPIPMELEFTVEKSLREGKKIMKKKIYFKRTCAAAASIALILAALTVGINTNEAFAQTLLDVPVFSSIVRVLTFKEYTIKEDLYNADIQTPAIEGLENKDLENSLNEKYQAENKELYEQFIADMESLEENGGGHMGVDSGYIVKTDTDKILSVGRYIVNTVGSSSTTFKFDTIDKENEVLITLKSLFKDDSYVDIISKNIKEQMIEQHKEDENKMYWVEGVADGIMTDLFEKISKDQNFYISKENKLIISFDKYEVAPGSMGVVEFEIPTEVLSGILMSEEYIK
ncbi:MAG: RsiV family protein [Sedimentibacter sp.]